MTIVYIHICISCTYMYIYILIYAHTKKLNEQHINLYLTLSDEDWGDFIYQAKKIWAREMKTKQGDLEWWGLIYIEICLKAAQVSKSGLAKGDSHADFIDFLASYL